jgi:multidrug efflux pump subunit AcrA (membrane-fusion protein)
MITKGMVDVGDFVGASGKSAMLSLERLDKLRLRVYVPESHVNSLSAGDGISFRSQSVNDRLFSAKPSRKSGSIDQTTRTELWEYEYQNQSGELKPGMYVLATLQLNRPKPSFFVPSAAIITSQERKFVIRVIESKADWIDLRKISKTDGLEIFRNLNEGDILLARGSEELKQGTEIKTQIIIP